MMNMKKGLAMTDGSLDWMESNRVAGLLLLVYLCIFQTIFRVMILLKPLVQRNINVAISIDGSCV